MNLRWDFIIFLEGGYIVEQGNPKELIARGGRFQEDCNKSNIQY